MKRHLTVFLLAVWTAVGGIPRLAAAETDRGPHFQEVLRLIRAHLPGVTEDELSQAMVEGLLTHFHPRVLLVTNASETVSTATNLVLRSEFLDGAWGYLRIGNVAPGLASQLDSATEALRATNQVRGWILDLRYAGGEDYRAAAEVVERFVADERVLLGWNGTALKSAARTNAITVPTAVIIHGQTRGAGEALAAALREFGPALLVGRNTAGQAAAVVSYPLGEGRDLQIANATLFVGESHPLTNSVVPDVNVSIAPENERAFYDGSTPPITPADTASRARPRINEATLIRRQRESSPNAPAEVPPAAAAAEPEIPAVRDPDLARAIDLLKAIQLLGRPSAR